MTPRRGLIMAALITLTLSACSSGTPGKNSAGRPTVVTSFYPLQFATEQIGGAHIAVTNLTRHGAEPHDIELTTQDVATVSEAGLIIYEKGLQGAVDKAVESQAGKRAEQHEHEHGPYCGHPAIEHEHHVDYLHDGHRHAPHEGHYDEHNPQQTHDEPVRH